jgi:hypothetical protein
MAKYLNAEVSKEFFSKTGFRWDFLLYSALPIFIGWIATYKKSINDKTYSFILHTYIFSNAFWVLINTAAYSNRFAYLSWFLYHYSSVKECVMHLWKQENQLLKLMLL